jgi:hypothetical protein
VRVRRCGVGNGFQAIKFVDIDFSATFDRLALVTGYAQVRYTATGAPSRLQVVMEAPTGTLTTFLFEVNRGEEVLVIDQVVHITAHCVKQEPGNTIRCEN